MKRIVTIIVAVPLLVATSQLLLTMTSVLTTILMNSKQQKPAFLKKQIATVQNTQHVPGKEKAMPLQHWLDSLHLFEIEEPDFCDRHPDLQIIGYVHSNISATRKRNVTRMTWANKNLLNEHNINMAVVFIVGRPKNQEEERIVQEESQRYGDLVQGKFDDEKSVSDKVLTALAWISRHCSSVPWTLHVYDDVLVDPFLLNVKVMDIQMVGVIGHFYCHIFNNMRVEREGKWRVAPEDFSKEVYPTYCSGSMWFVPTTVIPRLLEASRTLDYQWVNDVYLTGIVAEKSGVGHTHERFNSYWKFHGINDDDIDKKLVWTDSNLDREYWWQRIVLHQKLKMRKPWKDDPNGNPVLPRRLEDVPFGQPPTIPTKFLIEEADFCTEKRNPRLRMISFVISSISASEKRASTRLTWANSDNSRKYGIRMAVVFIVGRAKNEREKKILDEESLLHHDMIQGDFEDRYNLLTYKTLAGLVWVHRHCSHVPWTFKADDDILVNNFLLDKKISDIETLHVANNFYCHVFLRSAVLRKGKWGVLLEEYPEDEYPPYCDGPMWLVPTSSMPRLLAAAQTTNFLRIEDAYVTGLLARKTGIGHTLLHFNRTRLEIVEKDFDKTIVWEFRRNERANSWPRLVQYHLSKKDKKVKS